MSRLHVGILFGGCSEEHRISVLSAREVARHLDLERYTPHYVGITTEGVWKLCDEPRSDWELGTGTPALLSPDRSVHGLLVLEQGRMRTIRLDVVIPVLHGTLGEDGAMQGLLELSGIPYVGCDIQASSLCMDKSLTYLVARDAGIATPSFCAIPEDGHPDPTRFDYPVFVKPARSGSSFGVSRVEHCEDLATAIETARQFDSKVLIEEMVVGAEVGCAVLGSGRELFTSEPDRIALSHGFFRIHQESDPESGSENAEFIVPADVSSDERDRIRNTAETTYRALECRGLARVDLFLRDDGSVVLNEVNTMPGFTSYSRYPRMMAASGMPLAAVIDLMISLALDGAP